VFKNVPSAYAHDLSSARRCQWMHRYRPSVFSVVPNIQQAALVSQNITFMSYDQTTLRNNR